MGQNGQASDFSRVDSSAKPSQCVEVTDRLSAINYFEQIARQIAALMELRAGDAALDVGCGTGEQTRMLAGMVGASGAAIGIDVSAKMLTEAASRTPTDSVARFGRADARVLPFADCSFDACRAERVLLHVAEPRKAIQEMLRVSKPGARLVFSEPDWGSAILDSPDWRLTETILRFYCETLACGRIGRMLPGLLMDEGLTDVTTIPSVFLTLKNPNLEGGPLAESAECAVRSGIVSAESRDRWLADLRETDARGRFFFSITCFTVRAIRPLSIH